MKEFKTILTTALTLSVLMGVLSSCGNKTREKEGPQVALAVVEGVGFQQVFDEVIKNNCLECHNETPETTYSSYRVVSTLAPKILSNVLSGRMPRGKPPLSLELKAVLQSWVDAGAPEEAGGAAAEQIPLEPTYDSLLVNFFLPKCLGCHSGTPGSPAPADINFASYDKLIATNKFVEGRTGYPLFDTEEPELSDFAYVVAGDPESDPVVLPAMPPLTLKNSPDYVSPGVATEEELETLYEWMRRGLPKSK